MNRLVDTVLRFSFEKQAGRIPGQGDPNSLMRKGIVGDWRNWFTREAGEVFDHYCGETLVRLGYEADRKWFENLPLQPSDVTANACTPEAACGRYSPGKRRYG